MAGTSRFFQLTNEILVEYVYTEISNPDEVSTTVNNFNLIEDSSLNINYLTSADDQETVDANVRDNTAVQLNEAGTRWASLDLDRPLNYLDFDPNFTSSTNAPISFSPDLQVRIDTVRFHFVAGFEFQDSDGRIVRVLARDRDGTNHSLATIALTRGNNFSFISPRPLLIGDRIFDTQFEITLPSQYFLNQEFLVDPNDTNLIAHRLTDGRGLTLNNPIYLESYNINRSFIENGLLYFETNTSERVAIPQVDEFADLNASVQESSNGDFFELTGVPSGSTTLEDFIGRLNIQPNSNWVLIHEITISEQVGTTFIRTADISQIQDRDFDQPIRFRPIILNSSNAVSWTLDYSLRLYNRVDNQQIIKNSSLTSFDVKKYGRSLEKLDLGIVPTIDRIYNAPVNQGNMTVMSNRTTGEGTTRFVANFIQNTNIAVGISNELTTSSLNTDVEIARQGEGIIVINPFDNFIKFTLYTQQDAELSTFNIAELGTLQLNFRSNSGDTVVVSNLTSDRVSPEQGEVLFKIDNTLANRLFNFANGNFFLTLTNNVGDESLMYTGQFETVAEFNQTTQNTLINNLNSQIVTQTNSVTELNNQVTELGNQVTQRDLDIAALQERNAILNARITALENGLNPDDIVRTTPAQVEAANAKTTNEVKFISENDRGDTVIEPTRRGLTIKRFKPNPNL